LSCVGVGTKIVVAGGYGDRVMPAPRSRHSPEFGAAARVLDVGFPSFDLDK
jgi:hypothetical protein